MSVCQLQSSAVELYFYDELSGSERQAVERHLAACLECRRVLDELHVIREALASRPVIEAPPGGDWSAFMRRLDTAVRLEEGGAPAAAAIVTPRRFTLAPALAMAAVLTLVTAGVLVVVSDRSGPGEPAQSRASGLAADAPPDPADVSQRAARDPGLASVAEQHIKRSTLVVLGLATRDPADPGTDDWLYERRLASSLLNDTRLYRRAAEDRGMHALADMMRDLEIVLLQASMSEEPDAEALAQIQRLIRRRDLITKMEVVSTTGLAP